MDIIIDQMIKTLHQDMKALETALDQGCTLTEDNIKLLREIKDGFVHLRNKDIHNEARAGKRLMSIADKWGITDTSASQIWEGIKL